MSSPWQVTPTEIALLLLFLSLTAWAAWPGKRAAKQTCWVYCPKCNAELTDVGHFIEDTDLVRYECAHCGHKSGWDFGAPVPILIEGKTEVGAPTQREE